MSYDRFRDLIGELCQAIDLPDADAAVERGAVEVEGFEVLLNHYENDDAALYLNFHYGIVTPGRTLRIYRLLLEANLNIYAQDQAQLGIDPQTTGIVLIVRVPMSDSVTGDWLAETLAHYAEHGRYWQTSLLDSPDEMFMSLADGHYDWIRA